MRKNQAAGDRMRRLLAMMPWLRERPGVSITEAAANFGLTEQQLLADLHVVFMVGLPPYTPDALVDVTIDEDNGIWVNYAVFFLKPLRLTPAQGLALLASSDALLSVSGTDPDGALARALTKLASSLNIDADEGVDVQLGMADDVALGQLRAAVAARESLTISYYSFARDELGGRVITPWRVFADSGAWYVEAFCRQADGVRLFRVDRIASIERGPDDVADVQPTAKPTKRRSKKRPPPNRFETTGTTVRLRLDPSADWVKDTYRSTIVAEFPDGSFVIDLPVSAQPWLERLLLRLGANADLIDAGDLGAPESIRSDAARRILSRYGR